MLVIFQKKVEQVSRRWGEFIFYLVVCAQFVASAKKGEGWYKGTNGENDYPRLGGGGCLGESSEKNVRGHWLVGRLQVLSEIIVDSVNGFKASSDI